MTRRNDRRQELKKLMKKFFEVKRVSKFFKKIVLTE